MSKSRFYCHIYAKLEFSWLFEKYSSTKFHEIPSMRTDGQTDMTKLTVAFRNSTHLTRSHFSSIFSQTQKLSIKQVGNFVETRPSAVALNQADSKQKNKIFAIFFESRTLETELNREIEWFRRERLPYIASAQIFIPILLYSIYIITFVVTFMEGIHNYIPERNCVCIVHIVTAVLCLQSVLHVTLFGPWIMFCTFTSALPAVCVQCTIWLVSVRGLTKSLHDRIFGSWEDCQFSSVHWNNKKLRAEGVSS